MRRRRSAAPSGGAWPPGTRSRRSCGLDGGRDHRRQRRVDGPDGRDRPRLRRGPCHRIRAEPRLRRGDQGRVPAGAGRAGRFHRRRRDVRPPLLRRDVPGRRRGRGGCGAGLADGPDVEDAEDPQGRQPALRPAAGPALRAEGDRYGQRDPGDPPLRAARALPAARPAALHPGDERAGVALRDAGHRGADALRGADRDEQAERPEGRGALPPLDPGGVASGAIGPSGSS